MQKVERGSPNVRIARPDALQASLGRRSIVVPTLEPAIKAHHGP